MKRLRQILIALAALLAVPALIGATGAPGSPLALRFALTAAAYGCAGVALIAARGARNRVWIIAGLVLLAALQVPTAMLVQLRLNLPPEQPLWLTNLFGLLLYFTVPATLAVTAMLLHWGLALALRYRQTLNNQPGLPRPDRLRFQIQAAGFFLLAALLMAKSLHNIYWLMVWDTTDDSLGLIYLFGSFTAVIFAGVALTYLSPGSKKLVALYALLVPVLLIGVSALAQQVDFRQLTGARAARVVRAIEAYHAREGRYPQNLGQLVPWYALALPGPVVISPAQPWCYDGGGDSYRLGYVSREHWSSPILVSVTSSQQGTLPDLPPICSREIARIVQYEPGYFHAEVE